MPKLKFYAGALAVFATTFFAGRLWGEFTINQSLLLALLGAIGWKLFQAVRAPLEADLSFSPFWVRVSPNWDDLFVDLGLLDKDPQDFWEEVRENSDHHSVLFRDIAFTVLKPGRTSGLVYLNDHQVFTHDINVWERISEIQIEESLERQDWSPKVFVKSGPKGLELGLEVNSRWWKTLCRDDKIGQLTRIESDPDHSGNTTRLTLAVLPYSEFGGYIRACQSNPRSRWQRRREKDWEAETEGAGWKREQMDSHLIWAPSRIEHRYFTVVHKSI